MRILRPVLLTAIFALPLAASEAALEHFEKEVRPLLTAKCGMCHNPDVKTGGLDLTSVEGYLEAKAGGFFGTPDGVEQSLMHRALQFSNRVKMPPAGKLPADELAAVSTWLKAGAPWPGADEGATPGKLQTRSGGLITDEDRAFWSFTKVEEPAAPEVTDEDWIADPLDRFVLAKLESKDLRPAPPADKLTLLRRVTFDLIGLPPTESELAQFLADDSPDAFAQVVDRLLASPRYGERWGRHWLDVARYADSTGSDEDHRYPHAWRYRDYVIAAFNDDMPFDQFVREQIAGDILAKSDPEVGYRGVVATGFLSLGKKALAQRDLVLKRYDVVDDQIDVTAKAFLGLTVTCARCHDHKFDPILQKDYYGLASIFASTWSYEGGVKGKPVETPLVPEKQFLEFTSSWDAILDLDTKIGEILDLDKDQQKFRDRHHKRMADYMLAAQAGGSTEKDLDAAMLAKWVDYLGGRSRPELAEWRAASDDDRAELASDMAVEFGQAAAFYDRNWRWWSNARKRYPKSGKLVGPKPEYRKQDNPFFYTVWLDGGPLYRTPEEQMAALEPDKRQELETLLDERAALEAKAPTEEVPMACAVTEGGNVQQRLFIRGQHDNPGEFVPKSFPRVITPQQPNELLSISGRLELAQWLASADNPLTARVFVNRVWQGHFGDAIVRSPNNFGKLGEPPTHPKLLDHLAATFVAEGWSVKKLHRKILLSATYRMSGAHSAAIQKDDPENRLLSHFPRRRLSIEEIRDAYLAIGGTIDLTMGGTLDPGIGTDGETSASRISLNPDDFTRRSVYMPLRRANLPNLYNLFDFGDATSSEGKRQSTTVATQALFMMNSDFLDRQAKGLADELLSRDAGDAERVRAAYLSVVARPPDGEEIDRSLTYIESLRERWSDVDEAAAWRSLCRVLMASNEFVFVF